MACAGHILSSLEKISVHGGASEISTQKKEQDRAREPLPFFSFISSKTASTTASTSAKSLIDKVPLNLCSEQRDTEIGRYGKTVCRLASAVSQLGTTLAGEAYL